MSMLNENDGSGDKRTIFAVVLSVVVISAGFLLQSIFFPVTPDASQSASSQSVPASANTAPASNAAQSSQPASSIVAAGGDASAATKTAETAPAAPKAGLTAAALGANAEALPIAEKRYTISTDLLEATLSNKGGDLVSLKLKKHADHDGMVDLIVPKADGSGGLSLSLGGASTAPVSDFMNASFLDDHTISFSRSFLATVAGKTEPVLFTLKKTYTFRNGDYLFGLAIGLENSLNENLPLDAAGIAYTISVGPQIGPKLTAMPGGSNDMRSFVKFVGGKKKDDNPKAGTPMVLKDQPTWVGISGKYFTFLAVPQMPAFTTTLSRSQDPTLFQSDSIAISRPAIKASKQTDLYYFYFGPKTNGELGKYDYADKNAFGLSGLSFERAADTSGILSWLEWLLKGALNIFYWMIPNYGVAIILLTVLVKALLFPLSKNGAIASARMQELQPQMQALQEKYKNNQQKLQQEMAEFYKREGYNPMSGCLPLLIQFPIFIAMYNLFNNHFDLRGALFLSGWIPDLSQPEAIFRFPQFDFLFLHLDAIRALPIIYLVSQLFYGKYTQTATPQSGQNKMQMNMMLYWMPIIFFFILYNTPSGLLVYWIVSNVISIAQQIVINDIVKHRKAAAATATASASSSSRGGKAASGPVLAPGKKGSASGSKIVKGDFGKGSGKKK